MAAYGDIVDGYRLIRPIGRGGFGEVWLCRLEATGERKALKFLPASDPDQLERELAALIRYRAVASQLQCAHLLSIEHVNRTEDGLFYIMPLADGTTGAEPNDPAWQPMTLAALIDERGTAPAWFGPAEIREVMIPLMNAVQQLGDAGVVHRDIKPENILFIGGRPCLGDISLLTEDAAVITRRGTPGYAAPSWYLESGGNPDMWGVATVLYSMVTGNAPDKLGRAAFLWPPQGASSVDQEEWSLFHRIILRATHEKASERYLRFEDFGNALRPSAAEDSAAVSDAVYGTRWKTAAFVLVGVLILSGVGYLFLRSTHVGERSAISADRTAVPGISAPAYSGFDKKVAAASNDFESLLNQAQIKVLGNIPPKPLYVEKFNGLVAKLKAQSAASPEEIRQTLKAIDGVVPGVQKDLLVPNREELNWFVDRLYKASNRPEALAQNAEEGFRGRRIAEALLTKAVKFQEQAEQIISNHLSERSNLVGSLSSAIANMPDAAEYVDLKKLVDSIVKKIQ